MDIRTIILALGFGNLVFGMVLIVLQESQERSERNPFWIAAKCLQGAGWLLLAARGTVIDLLSYTLGNFCLLAGFSYECWAIFQIANRPVASAMRITCLIYLLAGLALSTPLPPSKRLAITSLLASPLLAIAARKMLQSASKTSPLQTFMAWSIALLALIACFRGVLALIATEEFALFSPNTIQFVTFAVVFYIMLANGFGMLVLSKEKSDRRLREALEEQKAILDTLPTGICIIKNRVIVSCNPAMEAMFLFPPGTLPGQSARCLYENDKLFERAGQTIYDDIAASGRFEGEILHRRSNGEQFWAKQHGRTIVLGDRPKGYTVFSVTDIGVQKQQQELLARQKEEVEATLARIKRLEGLISICMYCKKIRTEQDAWEQLEKYITAHSDARFSHGICPDCYSRSLLGRGEATPWPPAPTTR
ncbi:PAS domain-containing protein [Desulfobulbus sp.]|uniref:PAS domain-containing protein n=1 Tax=Desulfobulbus sp. TaxID=895 RepID=UPI00286F07B1|nr:PAS domain-containing protein [Desulfobulbus sp.]